MILILLFGHSLYVGFEVNGKWSLLCFLCVILELGEAEGWNLEVFTVGG